MIDLSPAVEKPGPFFFQNECGCSVTRDKKNFYVNECKDHRELILKTTDGDPIFSPYGNGAAKVYGLILRAGWVEKP